MPEITLTIKQEKIKILRQQKDELYPELLILNKEYQEFRQIFFQKEQAYIDLRKKYEALDREEKLLIFDKPVKSKPSAKAAQTDDTKAKKAALKALDNLPAELRAQILKTFKKA